MFLSETKIRVRYSETDKMEYVYYGNYPQYYEIGRVEAMRSLGCSYRSIEEEGIMMPVLNMNIEYVNPAHYDDYLTIKTYIRNLPTARIVFDYEIYDEAGLLLNKGSTTLVFVDKTTRKPRRCPEKLLELLKDEF